MNYSYLCEVNVLSSPFKDFLRVFCRLFFVMYLYYSDKTALLGFLKRNSTIAFEYIVDS